MGERQSALDAITAAALMNGNTASAGQERQRAAG